MLLSEGAGEGEERGCSAGEGEGKGEQGRGGVPREAGRRRKNEGFCKERGKGVKEEWRFLQREGKGGEGRMRRREER